MSAGCAFSVRVRSLSGPSHISLRQVLLQRLVDLLKDLARRGKGLGQSLAHADGLEPWPGKTKAREL